MKRCWLASLVAAAALITIPGRASAATTIGSDLAPDPTGHGSCAFPYMDPCTVANTVLPGQETSPIDGVVVRWRARLDRDSAGGLASLKVIRPAGGGAYTSVNTSDSEMIGPTAFTDPGPTTFTFPTRQPIGAGDGIALSPDGPATGLSMAVNNQAGVNFVRWNTPLADGTARAPDQSFDPPSTEQLFNADVEPDCDMDGLGDETQDSDLSSCAPGTTPTGPGTTPTGPGTTPTGPAPTLPSGAPATCRGLPATIVGTPGDDVRTGTPGRDVMLGLGGNDTLRGLAGNDVICGAKGNDALNGGKGKDTLLGQKGNDKLKGGPGNDKLSGKKGKDTLKGGGGKDELKGGGGRDVCIGGKANDTASKCEVEKSI